MIYNTSGKKRLFKIAGAGIAGMTAAINLKKNGFDVLVYEKQKSIGLSRNGDIEGLENWIFETPMSLFFEEHGFDFDQINQKPVNQFMVHLYNEEPFSIRSEIPFFHLVRRGHRLECLDVQLFDQCIQAGVEFSFGLTENKDVDIISTGSCKAAAYIHGIVFKTDLADQVHLLIGNKFASKGYAYLIIDDGYGTLACAYKKDIQKAKSFLHNSKQYLWTIGIKINDGMEFGSKGSFSNNKLNFSDIPLKIGEAGGFQDYLFGFGMRMAMESGLMTAELLCGNDKQAKIRLKNLQRKQSMSYLNRLIFERLTDFQKGKILKKISYSEFPLKYLAKAYQWNNLKMKQLIHGNKNIEIFTA